MAVDVKFLEFSSIFEFMCAHLLVLVVYVPYHLDRFNPVLLLSACFPDAGLFLDFLLKFILPPLFSVLGLLVL